MTRAFHAGSTGSNPVRGTTDSHVDSTAFRGERHGGSAHASPTLTARQALRGLLAVALIFALSAVARPAQAMTIHPDPSCRATHLSARKAIKCYWPATSRATALRVAECESTASAPEPIARRRELGRWARNGTHLGIFQLGNPERRTHGQYTQGDSARRQVKSALSLYHDRRWNPWTASQRCWG